MNFLHLIHLKGYTFSASSQLGVDIYKQLRKMISEHILNLSDDDFNNILNSYIEDNTLILSLESFVGDKSSPINFSQSINDFIESKVKLHPDEYLWQHRRFKSTLGKDNFYK